MVEQDCGPLIKRAANALKNCLDKQLARFGITSVQGRVLFFLWVNRDKPAVNQRDIEAHLALRCSTVAGLIGRMAENGLLTRVQSRTDGRRNCLALTEKGRALYHDVEGVVRAIEARLLDGMSGAETEQLRELLGKVLHNLEQI